jgi:hypothetical protein
VKSHAKGIIFIACLIISTVALVLWHLRTRTNTLEAVDALTGAPLPIEFKEDIDFGNFDDPTWIHEGWVPPATGGGLDRTLLDVEWNKPIRIFVSSEGYERVPIVVNDESPKIIVIPLRRKATTSEAPVIHAP